MSITERKLKNGKTVYDNAFMYKGTRYKKGGFKKKGDAEDWEINVKYQVNKSGSFFQPCNKSFIEIYYEWYSLSKNELAPNTIKGYESQIKKIKQTKIANSSIIDLKYKTLQKFFNEIGTKYSKGVCFNIKKIFNNTFNFAMKNEYITNNPMSLIKISGKETTPKTKLIGYEDFLSIGELLLSQNTFNSYSHYIALNIGYYTGGRLCEVLALTKDDINFFDKSITFNKKLECSVTGKKPYPNKMKTKSSYATIPLADPLANILQDWFNINPYEVICCNEQGNYIRDCTLKQSLKKAATKLNINFYFHMLRHTYATNIVNSGVTLNIARKLLRHENIEMTLSTYAHSNIEDEKKAISAIFNANKKAITLKLPQSNIFTN